MNKRRLQAYKQTKRELKFERKQLRTENKYRVKEFRNQKKISKLTRPGLLVLKPVSYSAGRMKASAWQKAVNEDQDNDFLHAIDSAKRRIVEPAAQKVSKPQRLQKKEKQRDRLNDKKSKSNNRLNRQEARLKDKHDSYKKRKKPKPKKKKGAKDTISAALKAAWKFVKNVYESEVKKFFLCLAIPVIVILLVFGIITMLFSATSSHSGFTLGTYAAQDYDLSEAEKYYTELAYNLNQKIRKVSSSSDWKDGLVDLGANSGDLSDTPDEWVWGRSSVYDFDPVYDFDTYKLWSFLCAYYYDFDADNDDIYYWEFDGDTEDLLEEIFNDEYEFVYHYDNTSHWEELSPYNYWGGGNASSGTYYRAEQDAYIYDGQPYKYRFKPIAITSELSQYEDDDGYLCITDGYRVLDPNDDYRETGFFIMDHRWYSGTSHPFYYIDNDTDTFFFMHGGERHDRSFWGWDGTDAWFLVSPTDTHIWNSSLNDVCMYGYYEKYKWKTQCKLYYNQLRRSRSLLNLEVTIMNVKKIIKGIIGLGAIGGVAYAAYKLGESDGRFNEIHRRMTENGDEDDEDIEVEEDDDYRFYDNYDEPDDECLAPTNGNSCHKKQFPDHLADHSPVGYDENCENGDCFYVRLNAIDLDDIPTETALRALVATKHSSYITNKAIRAATGCSYDTAERILILFEDAGYISEKNNRFRHKVYIRNVELTKLI